MKKAITILLGIAMSINFANAQEKRGWSKRSMSHYKNGWSFGLGINIVDDSGWVTNQLFNTKENWNLGNPITANMEYFFDNKFSLASVFSLNKYIAGKQIDQNFVTNDQEANYFAVDFAGKYAFRELLKSNRFEPYLSLGFGYTYIGEYTVEEAEELLPASGRVTLNTGLGFNYWFSETWGVNLNALGKWALGTDVTDHKQYSIGVIYYINKKEEPDTLN